LSPSARDGARPGGEGAERVYLLLGPELGEKNDFIRRIVSMAAADAGSKPEEYRRYLPETKPSELVSEMRNGALFASMRVFIYQGIEQIGSKADASVLIDYIKAPSDDAVLVLLSDQAGVDKGIKDAAGERRTKIFWELFEDRKEEWVRSFFKRKGAGVTEEAVQAILELVENNTEALKEECSRLALFMEPGAALDEGTVEAYLSHNRAEDAFSLFDRICADGLEEALETLEKILYSKEGEPIGLLAGLQWCFARLESFEACMASGLSADEAFLRSGLRSKQQQTRYRQASARFPRAACRRVLSRRTEADAELRSSPLGLERLILQVLVYEIMAKEGVPIESWA